jgi:hypothetical protein
MFPFGQAPDDFIYSGTFQHTLLRRQKYFFTSYPELFLAALPLLTLPLNSLQAFAHLIMTSHIRCLKRICAASWEKSAFRDGFNMAQIYVDCIGKPTLCPRILFLNQARCKPKTLFTITSTTTTTTTSITFLAAVAAAVAAQLFWGQANVFERVHGMIVRNTSFFTVS